VFHRLQILGRVEKILQSSTLKVLSGRQFNLVYGWYLGEAFRIIGISLKIITKNENAYTKPIFDKIHFVFFVRYSKINSSRDLKLSKIIYISIFWTFYCNKGDLLKNKSYQSGP